MAKLVKRGITDIHGGTIRDMVDAGLVRLSPEDEKLLGQCKGDSPKLIKKKKKGFLKHAASIQFDSLPQTAKDIVTKTQFKGKPFKFTILPLAEIIVSLKYNIPNYHDRIYYIYYLDMDPMNLQRENLLLFHSKHAQKYPNYWEAIKRELRAINRVSECLRKIQDHFLQI